MSRDRIVREEISGGPRAVVDPDRSDIEVGARRANYVTRTTTLPPAASHLRGRFFVVEGGSGVADTLQVCLKAAGGSYTWRQIIAG